MNLLSIDIETYSDVDLKDSGLYRYVACPNFEVLMIGYSYNDEPEQIIDLALGDKMDETFLKRLVDPDWTKTAWNAQFELLCLDRQLNLKLDRTQWDCTMIRASMLGYPLSLDAAGRAMKLETTKDRAGKALIRLFTQLQKKTGQRVMPYEGTDWNAFKKYCIGDVVVEKAIRKRLAFLKISQREREYWYLDQKINAAGIMLDVQLVEQAVRLISTHQAALEEEAMELTGIENVNSLPQLKAWLTEQTGRPITALTKEDVKVLVEDNKDNPTITRLLEIRQELAKSSVGKYQTMLDMVGLDNRIRGILQFYGAGKTGRWAGRGIQPQNMTHTKIDELDLARQILKSGDADLLQMIFGNLSYTMSNLIRTALISKDPMTITDLSAIEARITAWFASEKWRLDVFAGDGKIYEASAAQMFKIDIKDVTKDIRSKGKVAELALGYQGSVGALVKMGALKMGLKEDELKPIVNLWREASPNIVQLWYDLNNAAIEAVDNPGQVVMVGVLKFVVKHDTLFIQLPSGRFLSYVSPHLKINKFDMTAVGYWGTDQITGQWSRQETYGGKLLENIVQGTARDVLADAMIRLDRAGLMIILHVHDEVVMETADVQEVSKIMTQEIDWAPGLVLAAETFQSPYYVK